jgi:thioredoxin-like negative regulator of GroEL
MDRLAMLQEVLAQNPNDAFARYGLAMEYVNQGDIETALNEFARLVQISPNYTAGYQMSAQTLLKAGREEEARKNLEAGIASAVRTGNQHARAEMEAMLDELR